MKKTLLILLGVSAFLPHPFCYSQTVYDLEQTVVQLQKSHKIAPGEKRIIKGINKLQYEIFTGRDFLDQITEKTFPKDEGAAFSQEGTSQSYNLSSTPENRKIILFSETKLWDHSSGQYESNRLRRRQYLSENEYKTYLYDRGDEEYSEMTHIKTDPISGATIYREVQRPFNNGFATTLLNEDGFELEGHVFYRKNLEREFRRKESGESYISSESISEYNDHGLLIHSFKKEYNEDGNLLREQIVENEIEQNQIISHLNTIYKNGTVTNSVLRKYNNEVLVYDEEKEFSDDGTPVFYILKEHDENNNLILSWYESYGSEGEMVSKNKTNYSYIDGNLVKEITEYKSSSYSNRFKTTFLYNSDGSYSGYIEYYFNTDQEDWYLLTRSTKLYLDDYNVMTWERTLDNGGSWDLQGRTLSFHPYNEDDYEILVDETDQIVSGSSELEWINSKRIVYGLLSSEGYEGDKNLIYDWYDDHWQTSFLVKNFSYDVAQTINDQEVSTTYFENLTESVSGSNHTSRGSKTVISYNEAGLDVRRESYGLLENSFYPNLEFSDLGSVAEYQYDEDHDLLSAHHQGYLFGEKSFGYKEEYGYAPSFDEHCQLQITDDNHIGDGRFILRADISGDPVAFKWINGSGETVSDLAAFEPSEPGIFTVYADNGNCYLSQSYEVHEEQVTKIDDPNNPLLKIYPNPVVSSLFLNNFSNESRILIRDIKGQVLYDKKVLSGQINLEIQMGNTKPGLYTLEVQTQNNVEVMKIVKH